MYSPIKRRKKKPFYNLISGFSIQVTSVKLLKPSRLKLEISQELVDYPSYQFLISLALQASQHTATGKADIKVYYI